MKTYKIKTNINNILKEYFQGNIIYINKKELESIKGKINEKEYKELRKILKVKNDPDIRWVYPKEEEEKKEEKKEEKEKKEEEDNKLWWVKLKREYKWNRPQIDRIEEIINNKNNIIFKEYKIEEDNLILYFSTESSSNSTAKYKLVNKIDKVDEESMKYVIPHRKNFIRWVNEELYSNIKLEKNEKIYQQFAKYYLQYDTPYRGLLIYHGLGTGKTATSLITSDAINMPITILLPASLETEYVKEIKKFGNKLFRLKENYWKLYKITEDIKEKYNLNDRIIKKIKKGYDIDGIYLPLENLEEDGEIYTWDGKYIENQILKTEVKKFKEEDLEYLDREIEYFIYNKYNFIHYNGWPRFDESEFKGLVNVEDEESKSNTRNKQIAEFLTNKFKENKKKYKINSPFNEEVIIIDEVHNFVRQIVNNSSVARLFYNWILNGRNIKLIFLSGTPIINKPSEIAILYNMLKGIQEVYNFVVNENINENDIFNKLKNTFYNKESKILQFYHKKILGKSIISFQPQITDFVTIMDDDNRIYSVKYNGLEKEDFLKEVYDGLHKIFDKNNIIPKEENLRKINFKDKLVENINIPFHKKHRLFDIYVNDYIDCSNNESFMHYFFDSNYNISDENKILLRRMLLGLTSYYPIDKKSVLVMPQINKPDIKYKKYNNYLISEKINVIQCEMSDVQWNKYEISYNNELKISRQNMMKNLFNEDGISDYKIRTRQNCNIVYDNDRFRFDKSNDILKNKEYNEMDVKGNFSFDNNLRKYSPKFYEILKNINKFLKDGVPTGKILYYSDFRGDSGAEAFERILLKNGYKRYDNSVNIKELDNQKRFTFITGSEGLNDRKLNRDAYDDIENKYGEKIQIMIISSAGAEGISLKCVRQVHIMESYWNYIRIDQVFGRAIRLYSHEDLPEKERYVDQYLYLSTYPEGDTVESLFNNMKKSNKWDDIGKIDIPESENINKYLLTHHRNIYQLIQKIINIKQTTNGYTTDEMMFNIMERKYNISNKILDIIKESSVDCIQHTKDNIYLNDKCMRFSKQLLEEDSFFIGMSTDDINKLDNIQLKPKIYKFIEPNIHVLSSDQENKLIYYLADKNKKDIRYIRENGKRILDYDLNDMFAYLYENKANLGNLFFFTSNNI